MDKCSQKTKLKVYVVKKCAPSKRAKDVYAVMKSVYSREGDRLALELPHCAASNLSFREAHALKRQIVESCIG